MHSPNKFEDFTEIIITMRVPSPFKCRCLTVVNICNTGIILIFINLTISVAKLVLLIN
nr:unnamed protein product [Callosobruchus analis]